MTRIPAETIPPGFGDLTTGFPGSPDLESVETTVAGIAAFTGLFWFLFVAALAFGIYSGVKNYRLARRRGYDPVTMQTDMATRLMDSQLMQSSAPPAAAVSAGTVEERLAEIDSLHERGVITADERAAARAKILGG